MSIRFGKQVLCNKTKQKTKFQVNLYEPNTLAIQVCLAKKPNFKNITKLLTYLKCDTALRTYYMWFSETRENMFRVKAFSVYNFLALALINIKLKWSYYLKPNSLKLVFE